MNLNAAFGFEWYLNVPIQAWGSGGFTPRKYEHEFCRWVPAASCFRCRWRKLQKGASFRAYGGTDLWMYISDLSRFQGFREDEFPSAQRDIYYMELGAAECISQVNQVTRLSRAQALDLFKLCFRADRWHSPEINRSVEFAADRGVRIWKYIKQSLSKK